MFEKLEVMFCYFNCRTWYSHRGRIDSLALSPGRHRDRYQNRSRSGGLIKAKYFQPATKARCCRSCIKDKLIEHKQYIDKFGEDLPEIRNWKWGSAK
jgi:hypothetical protein